MKQHNPRKFRVSITEFCTDDDGKQAYGSMVSKAVDEFDCKSIFDLLTVSRSYSDKHGALIGGRKSKLVI